MPEFGLLIDLLIAMRGPRCIIQLRFPTKLSFRLNGRRKERDTGSFSYPADVVYRYGRPVIHDAGYVN
jgi:hypothetical protein